MLGLHPGQPGQSPTVHVIPGEQGARMASRPPSGGPSAKGKAQSGPCPPSCPGPREGRGLPTSGGGVETRQRPQGPHPPQSPRNQQVGYVTSVCLPPSGDGVWPGAKATVCLLTASAQSRSGHLAGWACWTHTPTRTQNHTHRHARNASRTLTHRHVHTHTHSPQRRVRSCQSRNPLDLSVLRCQEGGEREAWQMAPGPAESVWPCRGSG